MKVGILTYHYCYNFGANLQTLAVQELLRRRGCEAVVVDYRDPWRAEMYRSKVSSAQAEMHEDFSRKYLVVSPRLSREQEVRDYCNDVLDVVVVGSDQVFRLLPRWAPKQILRALRTGSASSGWTQVTDRLPAYWLPWPRDGVQRPVRASIAASACGTSFFYLTRRVRREARECLRNFDFVSVRDDWTSIMVKWLSRGRVKPSLCPDPVFALNRCFDVPPEETPDIDLSHTILVSGALEGKWLAGFRSVARDHGFTISNLPDPERTLEFEQSDFTIGLPLSPLMWYAMLSRAAGYLGGRFHGLVSCTANRTPAISLDLSNKPRLLKTTSRTYDLCCKARARSRYVPVNRLSHPTPASVFERLTDRESQAAMNSYAERAAARVEDTVDMILAHVRPCNGAASANRTIQPT